MNKIDGYLGNSNSLSGSLISHALISGVNVNKTITSIDYGALAQANSQYERNRLESIKYENEQVRRIANERANAEIARIKEEEDNKRKVLIKRHQVIKIEMQLQQLDI